MEQLRCGRDYTNIEHTQIPDKTSRQLPNGEYTLFHISTVCKICGAKSQKQRQTTVECQRLINMARVRHSTCHIKIVKSGRKRSMYRYDGKG